MLSKSLFLLHRNTLNVVRMSSWSMMMFSKENRFAAVKLEQGNRSSQRINNNKSDEPKYEEFRRKPNNRFEPLDNKMQKIENRIDRVEKTRMNQSSMNTKDVLEDIMYNKKQNHA